MNLSYTTEYYPNLDELSQQQLDSARAFVVQKLREKFVDVDLSPGTVTGDQVVAPLSEFIAAADLAFSRFMSDLDLGNVAEGIIYSCPFVEGFLGNFSVYDDSNLQSIGIVRLTFSADAIVSFSRNVTFRFGDAAEFKIRFSSEHGEFFEVLPSTSAATTEDDKVVLVQTSTTTWAVDVPVTGTMPDSVTAGTAGTINKVFPTLAGVVAVTDFIRGATPTSLPELARMARRIYHSMSANSRYGIRSTVYHHWPETAMVSPIMPNDLEMQRGAAGTALGLPDTAVDVYFRSSRDLQTHTQTVLLRYTSTALHNGTTNNVRFRGRLPLLHSPSKIISVKPVGMTDPNTVSNVTIYSRPTGTNIPYGLHFGTRYEEFYADITPVLSGGVPIIPLSAVYNGATVDYYYAAFDIEYEADPLFKAVAAHLESPDQAAAGVSTVVHSGPLVDIDTMTIYYHRRPGVKMLLNPALEKIVEYAKKAGYPELFTPAVIHDIMKIAGATMVASISVSGNIEATPSNRWFAYDAGFSIPTSINSDWYRNSYDSRPPALAAATSVDSVADMSPEFVSIDMIPNGANTTSRGLTSVMTKRTVRYRIEPTGINFVELA
jgi:hypothetical protein